MRLELLVEDESTRVAVDALLKRLSADVPSVTWGITHFAGKEKMWRNLRGTLRALARSGYADWVIVLVDQDRQDCLRVKDRARMLSADAGMILPSGDHAVGHYAIRVVQRELESWFLGDSQALRAEFPRLPGRGEIIRSDVDQITDAWETLHQVLQSGGYYPDRLPKVEVARRLSPHLDHTLGTNRSHSFGVFLDSLHHFIEQARIEG